MLLMMQANYPYLDGWSQQGKGHLLNHGQAHHDKVLLGNFIWTKFLRYALVIWSASGCYYYIPRNPKYQQYQ